MKMDFEPRTHWQPSYNPHAVAVTRARKEPRSTGEHGRGETIHHLIYAAMLDGVLGITQLARLAGVPFARTHTALRELAEAGYVRAAIVGKRVSYCPLDPCNPGELLLPYIAPEVITELIRARLTRRTLRDLSLDFGLPASLLAEVTREAVYGKV